MSDSSENILDNMERSLKRLESEGGESEAAQVPDATIIDYRVASRVARTLSSTFDLDEIVNMTLDSFIEISGTREGYIVLFDRDGELLVEKARSHRKKRLDPVFHQLSKTAVSIVLKKKSPLVVQDVRVDQRFLNQKSILELGLKALICYPMETDGDTLGVIYAQTNEKLKPFSPYRLDILRSLADQAAIAAKNAQLVTTLREENRQLRKDAEERYSLGNIIGHSGRMKKIFELIERVSDSEASILIRGESGTGKELVARTIHSLSRRKANSFVSVNCAAIPENLTESELFGIERGVATGVEARIGKFEAANGGTIFLDEIGDMPLTVQSKVLRILQEKEFEKVGSTQTRHVDVRVVAATNKDLEREISEGRFREDLFYRLDVFVVELPPLRNRLEDIAHLVTHFIRRFSSRNNKTVSTVSPEVMNLIENYDWPGNVRELENSIEHAVILCGGDTILPVDLPMKLRKGSERFVLPSGDGRDWTLKNAERKMIVRALEKTNGCRQEAAKLLGIHRNTLRNKIMELGLDIE